MTDQKRSIVAKDLYKIVYIEDPRVSPDGRWIAYVQVTVDPLENGYKRNIWLAPTDGGEPRQLTRGGKDSQPRWSPDGTLLAFTSTRNDKPQIYLLPLTAPGGEARALTEMPNGASDPAWSPDGQHIAFLAGMNAEERAKEDRGEKEEPPADQLEARHRKERKEQDEKKRWDPRYVWRIPYRVGTAYLTDRFQQIYVIPATEGLSGDEAKPRRLTDIDADHSAPEWTPDGAYLLTSRTVDPAADEPFTRSSLFRIRVEDGVVETLTDDEFADYMPMPSPDGRWIAYTRTPRENITRYLNRLTVIPAEGGKPRDLSLEFDRAPTGYDWLPDGSAILFSAGDHGDLEIYRVAPSGGPVEKVIAGRMEVQAFDIAPDGGVAFVASTPLSPPELFWQPPGADEPMQMTGVNKPLLDEVIVQPTHELRWKSHDGLEIQGWYILPVGYEEGKQYPLAFNIHGGPHVMWGPSARTMWHEWQFHAACGYVVFYCNPRGGDGYGQAFYDAIAGAWGEADFPDLMTGIDALLELGFVDEKHMAVTGGSYGGFMTAWVIGHTDRFAAAVSQRGVYNLSSFYGTSDVPVLISSEFGVEPWEDYGKLWAYSPLAYAHRVTTPLLLIHAENDYRVPIEQAEQLFAYIRRSTRTPVEMWRYPRDGHEMSRSGEPEHRVSRLTRMVSWFDRYCMPERADRYAEEKPA